MKYKLEIENWKVALGNVYTNFHFSTPFGFQVRNPYREANGKMGNAVY